MAPRTDKRHVQSWGGQRALAAENALVTMAYDYLFSRRFFLSGQLLEEHDRFQDLTLRSTTTVALGYSFFDRTKHAFSVGIGPAMVL
jgi:putative salt-induced outer membrane protein YdiY